MFCIFTKGPLCLGSNLLIPAFRICYCKYSLIKYCANWWLLSIQTEVKKVLKPRRILHSGCFETIFSFHFKETETEKRRQSLLGIHYVKILSSGSSWKIGLVLYFKKKWKWTCIYTLNVYDMYPCSDVPTERTATWSVNAERDRNTVRSSDLWAGPWTSCFLLLTLSLVHLKALSRHSSSVK